MNIKFQRSYAEFSENYLATHYSGGVNSLTRLIGGPLIMVAAAILFTLLNPRIQNGFLRALVLIIVVLIVLYGFFRTLSPLFNLFLVWLRRDTLFRGEQAQVEIKLEGERLEVREGGESVSLNVEQLQSVQHRTESTWLITEGDALISIPREGILEGDQEAFIAAIEELLYADEEGED